MNQTNQVTRISYVKSVTPFKGTFRVNSTTYLVLVLVDIIAGKISCIMLGLFMVILFMVFKSSLCIAYKNTFFFHDKKI